MANNLNTPWARLTQKEKAELIGIYAKYGYNDLAGIIEDYNEYSSGGEIHIKESKKGTFTAAAKKRGMSVQAFASKVLANKDDYSSSMVKKANFARNASKWHAEGGHIYSNGGKRLKRRIATRISEYTKGLVTPEEALIIVEHPSDFSKYLNWDEDKVKELKSNFYNNFYPYGYDTLAAMSALTGDGGQEEPIGTTLSERMARDYLFAEYLGIPQEERKEPLANKMYEESPYTPSMGGDDGVKSIRFSTEYNRNKAVEIYNELMRNVYPLPGKKRTNFKAGKQYVSGASDEAYWIVPGKSRSNFTVTRLGSYDFQKDPYSAALGQYVIGSGIDSEKGQYVSVYDKWDLNPISAAVNLPRIFTKKVQDLGDLSGGFGNPVSFYDRVYLDDYYGVDSHPEKDSYYGGYIVPSVVTANVHAEGGPLDLLKKAFAKNYDNDSFSGAFAEARGDGRKYFKWNGNRYNTKLDTESFRESNPTNLLEGYAIQDAMRRIMQVENSKDNKRGGWDEANQRWYPHRSPEGGADTIAYGIKLSNGTKEAELAKSQGYLTDEQALEALDTLVQRYYDNAKSTYDKRFGDGSWDSLSEKSKSILTDYEYNPGLKKFPKLMEGFNEGNLDKIKANYKRYLGRKELGRNRYLLKDIDSLSTFYPIYK